MELYSTWESALLYWTEDKVSVSIWRKSKNKMFVYGEVVHLSASDQSKDTYP